VLAAGAIVYGRSFNPPADAEVIWPRAFLNFVTRRACFSTPSKLPG
jgi:hypothetical protein